MTMWRRNTGSLGSQAMVPIGLVLALLVSACQYVPSLATIESLRICDGQVADLGFGWGEDDPPDGSTYFGTPGDDVIIVANGPVTVNSLGGNDIICVSAFDGFTNAGPITIDAGAGDDAIVNNKAGFTDLVADGGVGTNSCVNIATALNCDTSTTINVRARGTDGGEQFQLKVDEAVVATFTMTPAFQIFQHTASGTVTDDQVKVEYINDRYEPAQGIDTNLIVDYAEIGGATYQTEADSVFSTGTWVDGQGIVAGFQNSETLHANGYFHYGQGEESGGELRLVSADYRVSEGAGTILVEIARTNGSDGETTLEYNTVDATAVAGQDYEARSGTVRWADGETGVRSVSISVTDDEQPESDEQITFVVENPTGSGELLAPRTATITIDDNDSVSTDGDGLLGEYYDGANFTDRFVARVDPTVNFDWARGAPATGMGIDNFTVRWSGHIEPRYSETYTFRTRTDDGVRLWVDGQLVIDQWQPQPATDHSGQVLLEAGVKHEVRMEYFDENLDAEARLWWSSASQGFEIVPTSQLFAAPDPGFPPGDELSTQTVVPGLNRPISLAWTPDSSNMYVALRHGIVEVVKDGVLASTPFIDIRSMVNFSRDRGLMDLAVHPDFANHPYVYLLFTYDPPEVYNHSGLAGPDGTGNRAGRLIRVTADAATDYTTAVPGSEVILLGKNSTWNNFNGFVNSTDDFDEPPGGFNPDGTNVEDFIATDSESHSVGAVDFGSDGSLYVSIGDGASYNTADARAVRVQDIDNLSGKVLRIDALTGEGLPDNPFFSGDPDANRSKVYHYGFRNPFRIAIDPVSGELFVGDLGWGRWEEVNSSAAGANFGWPFFEGGDGTSVRTPNYQDLPEAIAFYASGDPATAPMYGLSHNDPGVHALILGDVYRGDVYPSSYDGDLFFVDFVSGTVWNMSFTAAGEVSTVETFATGVEDVVQIKQAPDGNLYFVDLVGGTVGRWVFQ